jgi:hypothetical protein
MIGKVISMIGKEMDVVFCVLTCDEVDLPKRNVRKLLYTECFQRYFRETKRDFTNVGVEVENGFE